MKRTGIILAALLILAGCAPRQEEGAGRAPVTVKVEKISDVSATSTVSYVGTAEAARSAVVSAPNSGRLVSLEVSRGDKVSAGQELARIESQTVRSTLQMAEATLAQARDGHDRAMQVYSSGSIPEVQMVEINTKLSQAEAAAEAARKALDDCTLRAPFDGYVAEVMASESVQIDMFEPVVRIMDISDIIIRFPVPESEINSLYVGQEITVDVAATGSRALKGRILSKGVSASPLSHSYDCTASLDAGPGRLMPGMVCEVHVVKDGAPGAIVPASIVQTGTDGRYLWTVEDGVVSKTPVTVGGYSGRGVIITEGLAEGDLVIVEGYQKVSGGMKVSIDEQ